MEKPAARGVGAAGSPDCSPQGVRRRRGSHRPVPERLKTVCEADNGPCGPSLQQRKIASCGSLSLASSRCRGYGGRAVVKRLLLASPRGYCAGVERAVETVERALALYGSPVYVRKQIVHNSHVVGISRRAARSSSTSSRTSRRARPSSSPRTASPRPCAARREDAAPDDDRRDLPARDEGAHAGAPLRRGRLRDRPDRPRGARGGRGNARRGARRDRPRPVGGGCGARLASRPTGRWRTSPRRRSRSTRRARSSPCCAAASRRSRGLRARTSVTRPRTASGR